MIMFVTHSPLISKNKRCIHSDILPVNNCEYVINITDQ